ncbi:MAG: oligosaccharide flippase family protein [Clostridia bacterium]|nr:oligosaccharide flippase family protein [Clostridia bacterium]
MVFRIYISNAVGAECMGLFQLVYTLYIPACTVAASGINLAAVRMISSNEAKNDCNDRNIMKCCFGYSIFFGVLALLLLFTLAGPSAKYLLKDESASFCLKILAFGLPFLSAASAINGYFTAKRKILKTMIIQISEDLSKIAVTIVLFNFFKGNDASTLCAVLVLGSAAGEIISCLIAIIFYIFEKKEKNTPAAEKVHLKKLLSIALPAAISMYIRSALSALENLLVPFGYRKFGYSEKETLEHIGVFRGMVFPLMMFPSTLLNAAAKILVPEISYAYEQKDMKKIESIAFKTIYSTLLFSFFISGVFLFFANELCTALYRNEEAGVILMLLSALVPIMYLDGIVDAILKGMDQQLATMRYSIIDSIISIALIIVLLPRFGVRGYIIVTYLSSAVNAFLGISRFIKVSDIRFSVYNCLAVPFLSTAAALLPVFVFGKVTDISLPLVADILISAALYIFFIVITKNEALGLRKKISDLFKHFRRHSETFAPLEAWLQSKPADR